MKKIIAFLTILSLSTNSVLLVSACDSYDQQNQEFQVNFELISKIEIKKTYNNKFGIRFYKENITEKNPIPENFWYLTDDGKYVAEFNFINNAAKNNIINILRIKADDYYPDFTLFKGWDLKNVNLIYKNNSQKHLISLNANLVADISILLHRTIASIKAKINQEWFNSDYKFTEEWWKFVKNNQELSNKINKIFIDEVQEQINLDINKFDFDWKMWEYPSNIRTDVNRNITSFVISIHVFGKNQLRNQYNYEIEIS